MRLFTPAPQEVCSCGHPAAAHEHFRAGNDCALCPVGECERFRSSLPLPLRLLVRWQSAAD